MISIIEVTTPTTEQALVSVNEARLILKIVTDVQDKLLAMLIENASAEVATYCNRSFGREGVTETFREVAAEQTRVYLSRWPVRSITSVKSDGEVVDPADYVLNKQTGMLMLPTGNTWGEKVEVEYVGGYRLPLEAPRALRQASLLFVRDAYYASLRGDQTVRMISHKDSRVIYFDPTAAAKMAAAGGGQFGSAAMRAAHDILTKFMRLEV